MEKNWLNYIFYYRKADRKIFFFLNQVKCGTDEEPIVLVQKKEVKDKQKTTYFYNLFKEEYDISPDSNKDDRNYNYYRRIQKQEERKALRRMSNIKCREFLEIEVLSVSPNSNEIMRSNKYKVNGE